MNPALMSMISSLIPGLLGKQQQQGGGLLNGTTPPIMPPQSGKSQSFMDDLSVSPLFNMGMGILAAGTPSTTPNNAWAGAMQGLNRSKELQQAQQDRQMREQMMQIELQKLLAPEKPQTVKGPNGSVWERAADGSYKEVVKGQAGQGNQSETALLMDAAADPANPNHEAAKNILAAKGHISAPTNPAPSNVQEWQYFQSLPPAQKEEYLRMKRANPWIDTGGEVVSPGMSDPAGPPVATIGKTLTPEKQYEADKAQKESLAKTNLAVVPIRTLRDNVKELKDHPGLDNITGWFNGNTPTLSQEGRNAQELLDSIKAQVSTYKLQSMRDASASGSAVGSVTEKEWPRLESALAALGQSQDTPTFQRRLQAVINAMDEAEKNINSAYQSMYGDQSAPQDGGWGIRKK